MRVFTLPVSGSVALYGPEVEIVGTPEFQRLAGIKQLGTTYVTFRGALHTRFEHSLGALHQAELMIQAIARNPWSPAPVDDRARRFARLGSLLHDLPHVPFGHTLEDEFNLLKRHDENPERIDGLLWNGPIGAILTKALGPDDAAELRRVLSAKKDEDFAQLEMPFVGDIVGNTVCADLLDYVPRDLTACGMPVALGDRFLDFLTVTSDDEGSAVDRGRIALDLDKGGMPRPDVESEVIKLLAYRYELAERVYFHHAKNAASVMIGRAVQEAGLASGPESTLQQDRNFWYLSDEMLLQALARPAVADALGLERGTGAHNLDLASALAQGVLSRRLYKIAYLAVHDDLADGASRISTEYGKPEARRALEERLAKLAGVPGGAVLVHVPKTSMMEKDALVRVRTGQREIISLQAWDDRHSRRVSALKEAHRRLWRVTVYLDPTHSAKAQVLAAAAQDELGGCNRYRVPAPPSAYLTSVFRDLAQVEGWTHEDEAALAEVFASSSIATRADAEALVKASVAVHKETHAPPSVEV
ncbi:MAG: putative phosphohydrolase [Acidimicrobiales bacterium]|nr:putative phosphohydrolase [Acidimicrobiales bacterium]